MTVWVGLTGGIGSGKSQAAAEFLSLGVPVLDTDQISRSLTAGQDGAALPAIRRAFGAEIFSDGLLNRAALRQKVFSEPAEKKRLEDILLPLILAETRLRQQQAAEAIYGIIEIPLLAEQPAFCVLVSRILLVEADENIRIARVMRRSGLVEDEIRRIMVAQADNRQRRRLADDILLNNGSPQQLREKTARLNTYYRACFQHRTQTSR